jgi:hypothetical protein
MRRRGVSAGAGTDIRGNDCARAQRCMFRVSSMFRQTQLRSALFATVFFVTATLPILAVLHGKRQPMLPQYLLSSPHLWLSSYFVTLFRFYLKRRRNYSSDLQELPRFPCATPNRRTLKSCFLIEGLFGGQVRNSALGPSRLASPQLMWSFGSLQSPPAQAQQHHSQGSPQPTTVAVFRRTNFIRGPK